ncbi:MAG: hypothetical protein IKL79_04840 [Clostridia bacterium]|nr:hypothetical protein [Clostridia bacterium]
MRGITILLFPFLLGVIIIGAVSGDSGTLTFGIIALIADIIIGCISQYLADRPYYKSGYMNSSADDVKARISTSAKNNTKEANESTDKNDGSTASQNSKSDYSQYLNFDYLKSYDPDNPGKTFYDIFLHLQEDGTTRIIENKLTDEARLFLLDTCYEMEHAPPRHTLFPLYAATAKSLSNGDAIIYSFRYHANSVCENAFMILVCTASNAIRLFAVETDGPHFFLCEYTGYSHVNYGIVDLSNTLLRINGILSNG